MFARSCHSSRLLESRGNPLFLERSPSKLPSTPSVAPPITVAGDRRPCAAWFRGQATDGFVDCLVATMDRAWPRSGSQPRSDPSADPTSFRPTPPQNPENCGSSGTLVEWLEQIADHIQMRHVASAQCTLIAAAAGIVHSIAATHHRPKPVGLRRVAAQVGSFGTAATASVPRSESSVSWETIGAD
jgi:hypothetical protein